MHKATTVPSDSTNLSLVLPGGVKTFSNGLVIPEGTTYDEWLALGRKITEVTGAVIWLLGDFLVYGDTHFADAKQGEGEKAKRIPLEVYQRLSNETGYAVGTIQNAKSVCARLPFSRRRENLAFSQAQEIVGRAESKNYEFWIDKALTEGLNQKALREQLRKANATHAPEANDQGTQSFLETSRQFARDFLNECDDWTPQFRAEVCKIMLPVMEKLD